MYDRNDCSVFRKQVLSGIGKGYGVEEYNRKTTIKVKLEFITHKTKPATKCEAKVMLNY